MSWKKHKKKPETTAATEPAAKHDPNTEPDWTHSCEVCGGRPILPATGMCGPCTFGDASTVGGNW